MTEVIHTSIVEAIVELTRSFFRGGMRFCLVGKIVSFDPKKQTCQVQPVNKEQRICSDGTKQEIQLPVISDVPIVILGGEAAYMTFPVNKDDECLLICSDSSIENWFMDGSIALPESTRTHRLCDAFAIVGIRNQKRVIKNYNNDAPELRTKDDKVKITYGSDGTVTMTATKLVITGDVEIQGNATIDKDTKTNGKIEAQGIVKGSDFKTDTLTFSTHLHGGVQTGTGESGTPI